jgi:hypothetical protein
MPIAAAVHLHFEFGSAHLPLGNAIKPTHNARFDRRGRLHGQSSDRVSEGHRIHSTFAAACIVACHRTELSIRATNVLTTAYEFETEQRAVS